MATAQGEWMAEPGGTAVETAGFEAFVIEHYPRLIGLAGLTPG